MGIVIFFKFSTVFVFLLWRKYLYWIIPILFIDITDNDTKLLTWMCVFFKCPLLCQVGELWRTLVCCKYINKIKSSQVILKGTLWCQVFQDIVCSVTVFPLSGGGQGSRNSGKDAVYRLPIVLVRTTGRMINHWWIVDSYIHRMQN